MPAELRAGGDRFKQKLKMNTLVMKQAQRSQANHYNHNEELPIHGYQQS
ncbi:MAG: hypothetical protein PCFJNLEI_01908 [Verrucomicrobiae bacterium]|nr:hypothetical protein [Verrucomicrobiae bacterium]